MFVYLITNKLNNKFYIGKTRYLNLRWSQHKCNAFTKRKISPLYTAFRKYGLENFKMTVLKQCNSDQEAYELERVLISLFKSNIRSIGYNLSKGGEGSGGFKVSQKNKEKYKNLYSGEKSHRSKLTNLEVENMINDYLSGNFTSKELANKYKINKNHVTRILNGYHYKDVNVKIDKETMQYLSNKNRIKNLARGEKNKSSKLTENDVRLIRKLHDEKYTVNYIAKKFNITITNVYYIIQKKTWTHVI